MNAKEELLDILETNKIKCVKITYGNQEINLKVDYKEEELSKFLSLLDFNYDDGYGGQMLYGLVWLEDGTWLSRGEYDGSEWWVHNIVPPIPSELT